MKKSVAIITIILFLLIYLNPVNAVIIRSQNPVKLINLYNNISPYYNLDFHGLDLIIYQQLEPGLSKVDMRLIAGPPDLKSLDNIYKDKLQSSWYYISPGRNSSVTRIIFIEDTIVDVSRVYLQTTIVNRFNNTLSLNQSQRLRTGMNIGQLIAIAGEPSTITYDQETIEGPYSSTWYYIDSFKGFITRIYIKNSEIVYIGRYYI